MQRELKEHVEDTEVAKKTIFKPRNMPTSGSPLQKNDESIQRPSLSPSMPCNHVKYHTPPQRRTTTDFNNKCIDTTLDGNFSSMTPYSQSSNKHTNNIIPMKEKHVANFAPPQHNVASRFNDLKLEEETMRMPMLRRRYEYGSNSQLRA